LSAAEVTALVMQKIDMLASAIGGEVGELEKRMKRELREEFQIELGQLRADLTVQRAADRGVLDLASWRNNGDAA
jgi:hypothetical protein